LIRKEELEIRDVEIDIEGLVGNGPIRSREFKGSDDRNKGL